MPVLDYLMLADGASQRPDGKIDIFGAGWDTIHARAVPTRHPQFTICVRVLLTPHEAEYDHVLQIAIMSPDGPEIARLRADIGPAPEEMRAAVPAGGTLGMGVIMNIPGLVFPVFGQYHVTGLWDGNEMRAPVQLRVAPQESPSPAE